MYECNIEVQIFTHHLLDTQKMRSQHLWALFLLLGTFVGLCSSAVIHGKKEESLKTWQELRGKEIVGRSALDERIIAAILEFLHRPGMDPFKKSHIELNIQLADHRINGTLDDVIVTGVSGLQINALHVSLLPLKADFDFTLPSLVAAGNYDIQGYLNDNSLFIFGAGPFQANLTNARAKGSAHVALQDGGFIVKSLDLSLDLQNLHVNIQHLLGNEELSDYYNAMINELGLYWMFLNQTYIENEVSKLLVDLINSWLRDPRACMPTCV